MSADRKLGGRAASVLTFLLMAACAGAGRSGVAPPSRPSPSTPVPASATPAGVLIVSPEPSASPAGQRTLKVPGVATVAPGGAQLADTPGGPATTKLKAGVVVPVSQLQKDWARITTPCELTRWVPAKALVPVAPVTVVLDPGHGGGETGAVGRAGLAEKTVNLAVAAKAASLLDADGIPAVLTRTEDYRATLAFRVEVARAANPELLISVHHNAEPDGKLDHPGSETYFQIGSSASRRLAGLVYEEVVGALAPLGADWVGDRDAGAKWRPNSRGGDYYGILRRARESGITAVLAELAFVSNPSEEALLAKPETQDREAQAIARAVKRYLRSRDPGSGFTTPYPREEPAGPGGGRSGCTDPS